MNKESEFQYFEHELMAILYMVDKRLMILKQSEEIFLDELAYTKVWEMLNIDTCKRNEFELLMNEMKSHKDYMSLVSQTETIIMHQLQKMEFIKIVNARISLNSKKLIIQIMKLLKLVRNNTKRERVLIYEDIIMFTTCPTFTNLYHLALKHNDIIQNEEKYRIHNFMISLENYVCDSKSSNHDIHKCKKIHIFDADETFSSMKKSLHISVQHGSYNDLLSRLKKYVTDRCLRQHDELLIDIDKVEILIHIKLISNIFHVT